MKLTRFRDIPKMSRAGSYEVDFTPDSLVASIETMQREEGLDTDPDFQRPHVWTQAQQEAYIEFFFRGGITARVIYLNNPSWHNKATTPYNDFVLVDGKQRLEAWRRFVHNEITAFGSYYKDFTDSIRMTNTIRMNVNSLQTRAEVLQWYLDFNSGGVVHTPEELDAVRELLKQEKPPKRAKK